jgi:cytochrome c553
LHRFDLRRSLRLGAAVFAATLCAAPASAQSPGEKVLRMGGANSEAPACVSCHGADLKGMPDNGFPRLAGLPAKYVAKQLHDFRSGARENPIMHAIAAALTEAEIAAVATELASRPRVNVPAGSSPPDPKPGTAEWLALRGDWSRKIPACVVCHGPSGMGVGDDFPPLAGQAPPYLEAQLLAFRPAGPDKPATRHNDPNHLMGHIAASLTEAEIHGLAQYFGALTDSGEPFDATRIRLR